MRTAQRALLAAILSAVAIAAAPASADAPITLDGLVVNLRGVPLADAVVQAGGATMATDENGRFEMVDVGPETITVTVSRVAYSPQSFTITPTIDGRVVFTLAPRSVRALHVAGSTAVDDEAWANMLSIASTTSINAMMIDVKTESGFVFSENDLAAVAANGANPDDQYDLASRVAEARAAGLYVIVRIVSFEDPLAAVHNHGWTAWDTATGAPYTKAGQWFLDPYDIDAREYTMDLAEFACSQGVDEVQFDYMRFPAGDPETVVYDGPNTAAGRQETIASFLLDARTVLRPMGCATGVDIFGFITNKSHEGGIGQQLELLSTSVDVISPMTYPSLYSINWYGFIDPSEHPGPVVRNANQDALDRMTTTQVVLRPWLQDFSYTAAQVNVQLVEADALGLGWMLWNVTSDFTVEAILSDDDVTASEMAPEPFFEALPKSGFYDVPDSHRFVVEIGWAADVGITVGCNAPYGDEYCSNSVVTRGQMAAFLTRALDLESPPDVDSFNDDDGSTFEAEIEAIAAAGITLGCREDQYCPDEPVDRDQMASFIARALGLLPIDDPQRFTDDDSNRHEGNIAAVAEAGITIGCDLGIEFFCPQAPVTRAQMAAFLYRALTG